MVADMPCTSTIEPAGMGLPCATPTNHLVLPAHLLAASPCFRAQVAAHAEHHLCVRKAADADGDRMVTEFWMLHNRGERLREISSMLGLPEAAAEELLQAAASQP